MKVKYVLLSIIFVLVLAAAFLGYRLLTTIYSPEDTVEVSIQADAAPDFTVYDEDNNPVTLSEKIGTPIVLNFWATWCGPCQMEMPYFDAMARKYDGEISFMMINLTDGQRDTVSGVKEFIKESGYSFPVYYDTTMAAAYAYSAYSIPLTVLIRPDGTVMTSHTGAMDENTLQNYLEKLLEE